MLMDFYGDFSGGVVDGGREVLGGGKFEGFGREEGGGRKRGVGGDIRLVGGMGHGRGECGALSVE